MTQSHPLVWQDTVTILRDFFRARADTGITLEPEACRQFAGVLDDMAQGLAAAEADAIRRRDELLGAASSAPAARTAPARQALARQLLRQAEEGVVRLPQPCRRGMFVDEGDGA